MAVYNKDGTQLLNVYDKSGNGMPQAFSSRGELIFTQEHAPDFVLLHTRLATTLDPGDHTGPQGLAYYGGYYFQFFTGDNMMRVFLAETFDVVGQYECTDAIHGNTMQFGVEVQDTGFPLLYVSTWGANVNTDSKEIAILKVSLTGYTKVGSITLPSSAGYHPCLTMDWENGFAYSVGFKNSLSTTTSQPNVITKYNFSDMSIIEQYDVPYMGVLNGWAFYAGKMIYTGNTWDGLTASFLFIDTETHAISAIVVTKAYNEEFEGFDVIDGKLIVSNWIILDGVHHYRIYSRQL